MKIKTSFLMIAGIFATVNVATADTPPDVLGTWQGVHENTDPGNSSFGQVNPMVFVVQSEVGTTISGDWDWLSGDSAGCPKDPCITTWTGTISSNGQLSIMGQFGDDYVAGLVGNTLSGTFTGVGSARGYGTWDVTRVPEISPASTASALTLLLGGLLVLTSRGRRVSLRTEGSPAR